MIAFPLNPRSGPGTRRHRHQAGFMILESLLAFAILASAAVLVMAHLHRIDMQQSRVRVQAHLGMVCNQYETLYRNVPWDMLPDAINTANDQGYILFNGGSQESLDIPYRVAVTAQYNTVRTVPAAQQNIVVTVDVYWSPPNVADENDLTPTAGQEVEFRRIIVTRYRY